MARPTCLMPSITAVGIISFDSEADEIVYFHEPRIPLHLD